MIHEHPAKSTVRTKHEFAKKMSEIQLKPHIINDTPEIVVEKIYTRRQPVRFHNICKTIPHIYVQYKIVIRVINIIISSF